MKKEKRNRKNSFEYQRKSENAPSIPGPVLALAALIAIIVAVFPYMALSVAQNEGRTIPPPVQAGAPDATVSASLHAKAANRIASDEPILFVASPEPGREGRVKMAFIPFGIMWTLGTLLWESLACLAVVISWRGARGTGSKVAACIGPCVMVAFGWPFVGIGVSILATPYVTYKRDLQTIYAITDRQALSIDDTGAHRIAKFDDKHFGPIQNTPYSATRSDLLFYSSIDKNGRKPIRGFWGIEKGEEAAAILQKKLDSKADKGDY